MPSTGIEPCLQHHNIEHVRAEFSRLYQVEGKSLKEIMSIFELQGINATTHQWKKQIEIWKIGKYNRESDMIFAAQKAVQRWQNLGKRTTFSVRGQRIDQREIDRYFKRRKKPPRVILVDQPGTPEALTYSTPPFSPAAQEILIDVRKSPSDFTRTIEYTDSIPRKDPKNATPMDEGTLHSMEANEDTFDMQITVGASQNNSTLWPVTVIIPSLQSPTEFLNIEVGLFAVQEFYSKSIFEGMDEQNALVQTNDWVLRRFFLDTKSACQNLVRGNVNTAQTFWDSALKCLPDIVSDWDPMFLTCLLQLVLDFAIHGQFETGQRFMYCIEKILRQLLPINDPIIRAVNALARSGTQLLLLAEAYLLRGSKYLFERLPPGHSQWIGTMRGLYDFHQHRRDWAGGLACLETSLSFGQIRYGEESYWYRRGYQLLGRAIAHIELANYTKAQETIGQFSSLVDDLEECKLRFYPSLLSVRGELRRRTGQPGAIEDLQEAWTLKMAKLGPAHAITEKSAMHLEIALSGNLFFTPDC